MIIQFESAIVESHFDKYCDKGLNIDTTAAGTIKQRRVN